MSSSATAELYTPLQKWQTRVLRLHPAEHVNEPLHADLLRAGLADGPYLALGMDEPLIQFEAISYTWGESGPVQHEIICNGLRVPILPSLNAALRRFRHTNSARYLWVDALCINQTDDVEKSFQVVNMFTIFRKARRVIAWLGEEGTYTGEALAYLRSSGIYDTGAQQGRLKSGALDAFRGLTTESRHALKDLLYLPWCRRVWIQQEVFAARELMLFCGSHKLDLEEYKIIARGILWLEPLNEDNSSEKTIFNAISNLRIASDSVLARLREDRLVFSQRITTDKFGSTIKSASDYPSIEDILLRSGSLQASDPRDYAFALLNLTCCPIINKERDVYGYTDSAEGSLGIAIDYSRNAMEVMQDVTRFIMNTDCSIAVLERYKPRGHDLNGAADLPSWTIDWRVQKPWLGSSVTVGERHEDSPWMYSKTNLSAESYHDYRDHRWRRQLSDSSGTLHLGGTLLAVVRSVDAHVETIASQLGYGSTHGFVEIDLNTWSHIAPGASPEEKTPLRMQWMHTRTFTRSYQKVDSPEPNHPKILLEAERLGMVRPKDILVHIDGMQDRLAYLRPTPKGTFSFVSIVDQSLQMKLLLRQDLWAIFPDYGNYGSRETDGFEDSFAEAAPKFPDFLLAAAAPHRDFIIC